MSKGIDIEELRRISLNQIGILKINKETDVQSLPQLNPTEKSMVDADEIVENLDPTMLEMFNLLKESGITKMFSFAPNILEFIIDNEPSINKDDPDSPINNSFRVIVKGYITKEMDPVLDEADEKTLSEEEKMEIVWPQSDWGKFYIKTIPSSEESKHLYSLKEFERLLEKILKEKKLNFLK